jgi:uncharacterized membrane protein YjgN (DUF898 family)
MNEAVSQEQDSGETSGTQRVPLYFHAEGSEYFRIWIINLVLTILTLGIYSAWAKVRTKRYFYGNTELAGDRFEYLANPIAILKGRLIAIAMLVLYSVSQLFFPVVSLVLLALLMVAMPWIVVRSLRFNAIMSSWRGIRFGFDGKPADAFVAYLLWPLFGVVTLGFGMPHAWYKQNKFIFDNHRFGQTKTSSSATSGQFFVIFFALMGAFIGAMVLVMILAGITAVAGGASEQSVEGIGNFAVIAVTVSYFMLYVGIYVIYQAMHFQVVYNSISVGNNQTYTDVTVAGWFKVVIVNSILLIVTLGIYYPWASVRMNRYIFSHLWVDAQDLDSFVADESDATSALGEELGEAFDLGIGV